MARVAQYSSFGEPDVVDVVDVPTPTAPVDGVVVQVRAAGINPIDLKLMVGLRPSAEITEPRRIGSDAAGVIVEIGAEVVGWTVGDEVIVHRAHGAIATHVVAKPEQLDRKPALLSWEQAAALGVPASTAYQALKSLGVTDGTVLLIHAGSGAVGQAAIQFARAWGATVVATGSARNQDRIRELGAIPVVYGDGLVDRLRTAAPQGYDLILDAAGTDEALEASFALVDDRQKIGTIVVGGRAASLGIRAWAGGSPVPLTPEEVKLRREAIGAAAELLAEGKFQIEIGASFPLSSIVEALRSSKSAAIRGKVVVIP